MAQVIEGIFADADAEELGRNLVALVDRLGELGDARSVRALVTALNRGLGSDSGPYVEEGIAQLARVVRCFKAADA